MSDKTHIEWTEATWNPVTGCTKVSSGCKHCYAERDWARLSANSKTRYFGRAFTDVQTHGDVLDLPLRWKRPRRIFVNSMSDLFHPDVSDDFIDQVFGVMWACLYGRDEQQGHVFQVLTKRPERMLEYLSADRSEAWAQAATNHGGGHDPDGIYDQTMFHEGPHPRIWLGVSIEDQDAADERIPLLLKTPAAVRWISAEPLLGPIDLLFTNGIVHGADAADYLLDWVVVGGESGPKARAMDPDWVRSIRDECAAAGVPFLFKQWDEWAPTGNDPTVSRLRRVGKRAAGRLLDGEQHDGYPEVRP